MVYSRRKKVLLGAWIFFGVAFPVIGFLCAGNSVVAQDVFVGAGCLAIMITYVATLVVVFDHLAAMTRHVGLVAAAYLISAICLVLIFASYISYFGLYSQGAVPDYQPMLHEAVFDPIYLSATTFTTLGIGDLYPKGFGGKVLVIAETLLGVTHSVAFVSVVLTRLNTLERELKD
jgi:hypothetical protein